MSSGVGLKNLRKIQLLSEHFIVMSWMHIAAWVEKIVSSIFYYIITIIIKKT